MASGSKHRSKKHSAAAGRPAPRTTPRQLRDAVAEAREVRQRRERDEAVEETTAGHGGILADGQDPEELEAGEYEVDDEDDDDGEDAVDGDEDWDEDDEGEEDEDGDDFDDDEDEDEEMRAEEYTAETYLAGHVIPLPSGKSIRVRPLSFITMIERDEAEVATARREGRDAKTVIPNHLLAVARRMVFGEGKVAGQGSDYARRRAAYQAGKRGAEKPRSKAEETRESAQLIDFLCTKLIASFPVSMKPQHRCPRGVVSIESIFEADKIAVVQYAMQGQTALAGFRR